ncbi:MAG: hypothetical protein HY782_23165 [Chloroflexi bacterium]|nr:hypothetical protein [Chloroflexota bacterium]
MIRFHSYHGYGRRVGVGIRVGMTPRVGLGCGVAGTMPGGRPGTAVPGVMATGVFE